MMKTKWGDREEERKVVRKLTGCMSLNRKKRGEDTPKVARKPSTKRKAGFGAWPAGYRTHAGRMSKPTYSRISTAISGRMWGANPARCKHHIRTEFNNHIWPDMKHQIRPDVNIKSGRMSTPSTASVWPNSDGGGSRFEQLPLKQNLGMQRELKQHNTQGIWVVDLNFQQVRVSHIQEYRQYLKLTVCKE